MRTIEGDDDSYDEINKCRIGIKIWCNADGNRHRDGDMPAVIWVNGTVFYYKDDTFHRDGGLPAIIYNDGHVSYWVDGARQK